MDKLRRISLRLLIHTVLYLGGVPAFRIEGNLEIKVIVALNDSLYSVTHTQIAIFVIIFKKSLFER